MEGLQGVELVVSQPFWCTTTLDGVVMCDQNYC